MTCCASVAVADAGGDGVRAGGCFTSFGSGRFSDGFFGGSVIVFGACTALGGGAGGTSGCFFGGSMIGFGAGSSGFLGSGSFFGGAGFGGASTTSGSTTIASGRGAGGGGGGATSGRLFRRLLPSAS